MRAADQVLHTLQATVLAVMTVHLDFGREQRLDIWQLLVETVLMEVLGVLEEVHGVDPVDPVDLLELLEDNIKQNIKNKKTQNNIK